MCIHNTSGATATAATVKGQALQWSENATSQRSMLTTTCRLSEALPGHPWIAKCSHGMWHLVEATVPGHGLVVAMATTQNVGGIGTCRA